MLVLPGKIHDLGYLGLGHFVGVDAAYADALAMHMHHDAGSFLAIFGKKTLKDVNDELHRRVVVIQHQHLVHRKLLRLRLSLDDDAGAWAFLATSSAVAHCLSYLARRDTRPRMILALGGRV